MPLLYRAQVEQVRRTLSVQLSDRAYEGWQTWTGDAGVTFTSMLECLGRAMCDGRMPPYGATQFDELLQEARRISADHRRRRRH